MTRLLKRALLLGVLALSSGCAPQVVATVRPFCSKAVKPVCIDNADVITDGTAEQIEGNNLALKSMCGKPPPCKKAPTS